MNLVVCEKKKEIGDSLARRIYHGHNGAPRHGLSILRTRNRIDRIERFLDDIRARPEGIDLLHVSFNGFASLGCCEYALLHDIPYVLSLEPDDIGKPFVADWERRYFELFARHSLLTILPCLGLNLAAGPSVVVDMLDNQSDDFIFGEILRKKRDAKPSSIIDPFTMLQCGDAKCLTNLLAAVDRLGDTGAIPRLASYGGQGLIYELHSDQLDKRLVIKVPNYPRREQDRHPTMERTLLKEAKLLEQCNAIGTELVPKLYAYDASGLYVAREFVDGRCLSEVLKTMSDNPSKRLDILNEYIALTEELFYAFHNLLGVVLKDYKARNIIVTEKDNQRRYTMVDLGSCLKETDIPFKSTNNLSKLGGGDFLHWAPEVLLGEFDKCDRRLDYYSFGVTCFRIIIGEHPYSNSVNNVKCVQEQYEREYGIACDKLKKATISKSIDGALLRFILDSLNPDCSQRPRQWFHLPIEAKKNELEHLHARTIEALDRNLLLKSPICKVAADKPSFILSSYCAWLVGQCRLNHIDRLCFLSRDGFILKRITESFVRKMGLELKCEYLYASRQSTRIIGIEAIDHDVMKWLMKKPRGGMVTASLVLKRLALDDDPVTRAILNDLQIDPETTDANKIAALVEDGRFQQKILSHACREKRIARQYFEESGLTDDASCRFALVDLGWQGRIPLAIKDALGLQQLTVFYFGNLNTDDNSAANICAWLFNNHIRTDWFAFFDKTIATDFVEIMATSDHKTLLHYGELLESLPEDRKDDALAAWGVSEYHQTLLAYANALSPEDIERLDGIADKELVFQKIRELTLSPSSIEMAVFGDYPYCSEQTDSLKRPFGMTMERTRPENIR